MEHAPLEASSDLLKLDHQMCFSIYAASRAITRAYRPILDRFDLTYPQYLVLLILWEKDGLTVNEIGRRLYLDSGTLTPLLKRLEQTGYINRQRDSRDERRVEVKLTDRGIQLKEEALQIPLDLLKETHLEPGEVAQTKTMVDQILLKLVACGIMDGE